jgi:hypothetical protein
VQRADSLAAGARAYYTYTPPAGSKGVCIRVTSAPLSMNVCSAATHARASLCVMQLSDCVAHSTKMQVRGCAPQLQ